MRQAAVAPYRSEAAVRDALADHEDLLAEAAEAGFLATDSAAEVGLDDLAAPAAGDSFDGVTFTAKEVDGEITPELVFVRERDGEVLDVGVLPERGEAFSTVNSEDGVTCNHHYDCPSGTTCCGCCQPDGCHHCCVCS